MQAWSASQAWLSIPHGPEHFCPLLQQRPCRSAESHLRGNFVTPLIDCLDIYSQVIATLPASAVSHQLPPWAQTAAGLACLSTQKTPPPEITGPKTPLGFV